MERNRPALNWGRHLRPSTVVLGLAVVLLLSGCTLPLPTRPITDVRESQIVGTWTAESPDSEPATIVIAADGTLAIRDVPRGPLTASLAYGPLDWTDVMSTTGTWRIGNSRAGDYPFLDMSLNSNESEYYNGTLVQLLVDTRPDPVTLFLQFGDAEEDERLYFFAAPSTQ